MPPLNAHLVWTLLGAFAALAVGSVIRIFAVRRSAPEVRRSRLESLRTWWILLILIAVASLLGLPGVVMLTALASLLGLREYLRVVGGPASSSFLAGLAFAFTPLHYLVLLAGGSLEQLLLVALGLLAGLSMIGSWRGLIEGYVRRVASVFWGYMLLTFALSYACLLIRLPVNSHGVGPLSWFLLVIVVTECNDIAQALVGRRIGRHKITPRVSPNKSWEGLLGGVLASACLTMALAEPLTTFIDRQGWPWGLAQAALLGAAISISGFFGDINMSSVKREAGVKDGSNLLPGQGGVIDRVDSLVFTAPTAYYLIGILAGPPPG